jgi:hypothetical protein
MRDYTEVFSNEIGGKMGGYVTGVDINNGTPARAVGPADKPLHTMSGVRLTAELRELERNNIVNEMHANAGRVSDYRRRPPTARAIRRSSIAAITAPSSCCSIPRPVCRQSLERATST